MNVKAFLRHNKQIKQGEETGRFVSGRIKFIDPDTGEVAKQGKKPQVFFEFMPRGSKWYLPEQHISHISIKEFIDNRACIK